MTNPDNILEYIAQIQNELLRQKEEIAQLKKQQLQSDRIVSLILEKLCFLLAVAALDEKNTFAKLTSEHMNNLLEMSDEFIDAVDSDLWERLAQQLEHVLKLSRNQGSR